MSEDNEGPWRGQEITRTDAAGQFRLPSVPAGRFLAARDHRLACSEAVQIKGGAEPIELRLGMPGGRARIQVTSDDGAPIADAVVHVGHSAEITNLALAQGAIPLAPPPFVGRTDDRGELLVGALPPGEHPVFVRAAGGAPSQSTCIVRADRDCEHHVVIARGAALSGRVRTPDGTPIAGALVALRHDDPSSWTDLLTDEQGRFAFECASPGANQLAVRARGFEPTVSSEHLVAGTAHRLERTLGPTQRLVGRVVADDAPRGGAIEVRATWPPSAMRSDHSYARTDLHGRFAIDQAPTDRPHLSIRLPGEPLFRPVDRHARWHRHVVEVRLPSGFSATGWIHGHCRDARGREIADARVYVRKDERSWSEVTSTGPEGDYRIGPLPPGQYLVFAESTDPSAPTVVGPSITLKRAQDLQCDLLARDTGQVEVELVDEHGREATGVLATIQRQNLHRRFAIAHRARFTRCLTAGDYELSVLGGATEWIDSEPFTVKPGETTHVRVVLRAASTCTLLPRGLPPEDVSKARVFTIIDGSSGREYTIPLLPHAPRRIGAVLPAGDYLLSYEDDAGTWRGSFTVAVAGPLKQRIAIPMHLLR